MDWTKEDSADLIHFTETIDSDNIKDKEIIKKVLLADKRIIHVLNNKDLEDADASPDEYFDVNILPYYMIANTQHNVQNFICYEIQYKSISQHDCVKYLEIVFYILCHQKNLLDEETNIPRHDLLAALIQDDFNHTNYFGEKIHLKSDLPSVADVDWACRTLTFEQITDNNLVKTKNGTARLANKDVIF